MELNTNLFKIAAAQVLNSAHIVLLIPWLLFLGMGLSTARLVYQAWQEQALLDALEIELRREKLLQRQKRSFVRLSSHYLRTPLTLVSNGIELYASIGPDKALAARLKHWSDQLKLGVDALLETGNNSQPKSAKFPSLKNANLYLMGSMAGALVVVSSAVFLLAHLDFSDAKLSSLIGEAAVLLMTGVLIYSARRGRRARQIVRKQVEVLLARQKDFDKQRNELVRGSLQNLNRPLAELKAQMVGLKADPSTKAIVEGIKVFEDVLRQFTILASLETGAMQTIRQDIDLKKMIAKVTERLRGHIESKKLQVRLDLKVDGFRQDPLLLEFVLNSLIENAVEFSPPGRHVDIISRRRKEFVELFVRDEGSGIEREKLTSLFQPFFKTETGERFTHQGMGLSLYLDKLVVNYVGGEIAADSQVGKGTVMKIRFPLKNLKTGKK
jgi:signal transduction histidine kinase